MAIGSLGEFGYVLPSVLSYRQLARLAGCSQAHAKRVLARIRRRYWRNCRVSIEVISGCAEPAMVGGPGQWVTPGGKKVYYPAAYRRAFGRLVYMHSTRRIQVGIDWFRVGINARKRAQLSESTPTEIVSDWYKQTGRDEIAAIVESFDSFMRS